MGTKRKPIERHTRPRVTPEVLELWLRLRAIRKDQAQRAEYDAGERRLCKLLGLDYWSMKNPLTVNSPTPEHREGTYQAECQ